MQEYTCRKLIVFQVILDTLTTLPFSDTTRVAAVAELHVLIKVRAINSHYTTFPDTTLPEKDILYEIQEAFHKNQLPIPCV